MLINNVPNLLGPGKFFPLQTPTIEAFQTKEVREPDESSGVRGEIVVRDFLIPTLTETLPVLSPGTVSTALRENWDTGKEYEQPPVLHPFYSSPPLAAAYAIQGSSAPTSMQSQTIQQSALSLKSSQSVLTPSVLAVNYNCN